jgi:hypothetical protein
LSWFVESSTVDEWTLAIALNLQPLKFRMQEPILRSRVTALAL